MRFATSGLSVTKHGATEAFHRHFNEVLDTGILQDVLLCGIWLENDVVREYLRLLVAAARNRVALRDKRRVPFHSIDRNIVIDGGKTGKNAYQLYSINFKNRRILAERVEHEGMDHFTNLCFRTYVYLSLAGKLHGHFLARFNFLITERSNPKERESGNQILFLNRMYFIVLIN